MSQTLTVHAVDFARFLAAYGSQSSELLQAVESANSDLLEEDEGRLDEEKVEGEPSIREALHELVAGEVVHLTPDTSHQYHFAISMLVEYFGTEIEVVEGGGPSGGTERKLDQVLIKQGFPSGFSSRQVFEGGFPPRYPQFGPPQSAGYLDPAAIQRIIADLKPVDIMGVEATVARWVIRLMSWTKRAAAEGKGLVIVWS